MIKIERFISKHLENTLRLEKISFEPPTDFVFDPPGSHDDEAAFAAITDFAKPGADPPLSADPKDSKDSKTAQKQAAGLDGKADSKVLCRRIRCASLIR